MDFSQYHHHDWRLFSSNRAYLMYLEEERARLQQQHDELVERQQQIENYQKQIENYQKQLELKQKPVAQSERLHLKDFEILSIAVSILASFFFNQGIPCVS